MRLHRKVWPWSEIERLRVEVRAVKLSCSAEAKKGNRLTERILILDQSCSNHRAQARRDQAYIDRLEANVMPADLSRIRAEMKERAHA